MAKSLVDKLLDNIFDAEWVGKRGEKLTERELLWVRLFGRKGKVLRNIYLPKDNGETSEVDVIFITQKGIFVFESKNYSGWIFGDEKSLYWTAMLPNKQKNQFYNPIMQNKTHMKWMKNFVGEDIPLFSIIALSERCELKRVTVESPDVKVINRDQTYVTVRSIWDKNPDVVSEEKIEELYEKLKELTQVDKAVKLAHIESIEKHFKQKGEANLEQQEGMAEPIEAKAEPQEIQTGPQEIAPDTQETKEEETQTKEVEATLESESTAEAEPMICPKCGSPLVLRTAKKGDKAGNQFYGCSSFPKCRYIKNME